MFCRQHFGGGREKRRVEPSGVTEFPIILVHIVVQNIEITIVYEAMRSEQVVRLVAGKRQERSNPDLKGQSKRQNQECANEPPVPRC